MPPATSDSANPFTTGEDENPFAGSASGTHSDGVVPAVVPAVEHSTYTVPAASSTVLPFQGDAWLDEAKAALKSIETSPCTK